MFSYAAFFLQKFLNDLHYILKKKKLQERFSLYYEGKKLEFCYILKKKCKNDFGYIFLRSAAELGESVREIPTARLGSFQLLIGA